MSPGRWISAATVVWLALLVAHPSAAQHKDADAKPEPARRWLRDRFGIVPLERALSGTDPAARERALERLGAAGGARALELLVRALEPSGAAQSPRERLIAVRALARSAREPKVRECLVRVMTGITVSAERSDALHALLRDTAALALSASGDVAALEALGKALRQPGRVGQAAAAALIAHPPADLSPIVNSVRAPTHELVSLLERLGDERAFEPLRDVVRRGVPELSARAAVALTRLGNFETVELAHHWARAKEQPVLLLAAAEILLVARDPGGPALFERLVLEPVTRSAALALLEGQAAASLVPALLRAEAAADDEERRSILAALGRSGETSALTRLGALLEDRHYGDAAAYALALSGSAEATRELQRRLRGAPTSLRVARAAVLRRAALGSTVEGLDPVLERLLSSRVPAERAIGAFGITLADGSRAPALLERPEPEVLQAVARAAPFAGAADAALRKLVALPAGPSRTQLALALIDAGARELVPTRVLLELVLESSPATPLAVFALAERDGTETRARLRDILRSPDPSLRAHVALGLGSSRDASALGLLEQAYRFEANARVRHAVVLGLARMRSSMRLRPLKVAADLDPDARVRSAALLATRGVVPSVIGSGVGTLWISLGGPATPHDGAVQVQVPGGLDLPVLADPAGVAALAGVPAGSIGVRLALQGGGGNAPSK